MIATALTGRVGAAGGIHRKIWSAFVLQVAAIGLAAVVGVTATLTWIKGSLLHDALQREAAHAWERLAEHADAALPATLLLSGWLHGAAGVPAGLPAALRDLPPGVHELADDGGVVLVQDGPAGRLYLRYDPTRLDRLALWLGFVPLCGVLVLVYLVAWLSYRRARNAVAPVVTLAEQVSHWQPSTPAGVDLAPAELPAETSDEVRVLAAALRDLSTRLGQFVQRERDFTRDASHELRTPLTVIRMAVDLLQADGQLAPHAARSLQRVRCAARDMEAQIEAFLILAREDEGVREEYAVANRIATEELDNLRPLVAGRAVELQLHHLAEFAVPAPSRALSVVFANLLRNACLHTERGRIEVRVEAASIIIEDSSPGMDAEQLARVFEPFACGRERRDDGHGIGLSVARRLCERFGWTLSLDSAPGEGTRATLRFPHTQPVDDP